MVISGKASYHDLQEAMKAVKARNEQMGFTHGSTTTVQQRGVRPSDQSVADNETNCQADSSRS